MYITETAAPTVTNLPSASSWPSTSNRNLFRGFGVEPRSRVLLWERSLLLTIWLIFWKHFPNCELRQNGKMQRAVAAKDLSHRRPNWRCTYPKRFTDRHQHSAKGKTTAWTNVHRDAFIWHHSSDVNVQDWPWARSHDARGHAGAFQRRDVHVVAPRHTQRWIGELVRAPWYLRDWRECGRLERKKEQQQQWESARFSD